MKRILLAVSLLVGLASGANAQYKISAIPRSMSEGLAADKSGLRSSAREGHITLPPVSPDELRSARLGSDEFRNFTFGISRSLPAISEQSGQWLQTQSGKSLWRLSITSPQAKRIALSLEGYRMPEGGRLFVYGSEGQPLGAFTHQNNSPEGKLQLAPYAGETITLEYEPAGGTPQSLPFRISALQHAFVDPFRSAQDLPIQERYGAAPGEPLFDYNNRTLPRLDCAGNVLRYPASDPVSRSVVLLVVNGSMFASGALINNTSRDSTAYVLTAAHTINASYQISDLSAIRANVASTVFFFGFESPYLDGNIRASEEKTLSGAELVAYNADADMALLRITGLPIDPSTGRRTSIPDSYNAYYAGWNIGATPQPPFTGIHHPVASTKRFNEAEDQSLQIVDYSIADQDWTQKHWRVDRWAIGTTASGSSGSPLLDRDGLIIGALSGGQSTCASPVRDTYFALRQTWSQSSDQTKNLAPWLDPTGSGATTCPGLDPHTSTPIHRLSDMYAKQGISLRSSATSRRGDVSGVGRNIVISEGDRVSPLGAYLVFSTASDEQKSLDPIILELSPVQGGTVQAPSWTQEISDLTFVRHESSSQSFGTGMRTMLGDTLEVYVPISSALVDEPLPAGQYILSVRTKSGGALSLPLLQQGQRSTGNDRQTPWTYSPTSGWQKNTSGGMGNYWLDLAVKGMRTSSGSGSDQSEKNMEFYYNGGRIYIYLPQEGGDNARMTVYNLNGMRMLGQSLIRGENVIQVDHFTTEGVYVALIESDLGKRSIKFLYRK